MIDRKLFLEIINAYLKEEEIKKDFEKFIDKLNSSYTVFNETPAQTMLIKILKEEFKDTGDVIEWFMFEDVEHDIDIENIGTYKMRDYDDLYDYLTILTDPEDDCAYFIGKKLLNLNLEELPKDENEMYLYICEKTDDVIKLFENKEDIKSQNLVIELKALREAIKKDNEKRQGY